MPTEMAPPEQSWRRPRRAAHTGAGCRSAGTRGADTCRTAAHAHRRIRAGPARRDRRFGAVTAASRQSGHGDPGGSRPAQTGCGRSAIGAEPEVRHAGRIAAYQCARGRRAHDDPASPRRGKPGHDHYVAGCGQGSGQAFGARARSGLHHRSAGCAPQRRAQGDHEHRGRRGSSNSSPKRARRPASCAPSSSYPRASRRHSARSWC